MIYRLYFTEDEIASLDSYTSIHEYVKCYDQCISIDNFHVLYGYNYCMFNGFLIFCDRVYCDDKGKLEELYNLFILMDGKLNSESESSTLFVDCIKLLGTL